MDKPVEYTIKTGRLYWGELKFTEDNGQVKKVIAPLYYRGKEDNKYIFSEVWEGKVLEFTDLNDIYIDYPEGKDKMKLDLIKP